MPDDFASRLMQQLQFHSFSIASVTGTYPSPNKRGLHCLSVLITDRMDRWALRDATTLSDRTH
jgi:hypothetical protein